MWSLYDLPNRSTVTLTSASSPRRKHRSRWACSTDAPDALKSIPGWSGGAEDDAACGRGVMAGELGGETTTNGGAVTDDAGDDGSA